MKMELFLKFRQFLEWIGMEQIAYVRSIQKLEFFFFFQREKIKNEKTENGKFWMNLNVAVHSQITSFFEWKKQKMIFLEWISGEEIGCVPSVLNPRFFFSIENCWKISFLNFAECFDVSLAYEYETCWVSVISWDFR